MTESNTSNSSDEVAVTDEEINSLDAGAIRFLKALRSTDQNYLDTSELQDATNLNKDKVNYRFRKLDELDFIRVEGGQKTESGTLEPKRAFLTERGRVALESLLEEDTKTLHEQSERLNELAKKVDRIERALKDNEIDPSDY